MRPQLNHIEQRFGGEILPICMHGSRIRVRLDKIRIQENPKMILIIENSFLYLWSREDRVIREFFENYYSLILRDPVSQRIGEIIKMEYTIHEYPA